MSSNAMKPVDANLLVSEDEVKDWLPNGAQEVPLQSHMGRIVARGQLCAVGVQLQPLVRLLESLGNAITLPPPSLLHDRSWCARNLYTATMTTWAAARGQLNQGEFRMAKVGFEGVFNRGPLEHSSRSGGGVQQAYSYGMKTVPGR